jgi:oligopeptide transport system permease protein
VKYLAKRLGLFVLTFFIIFTLSFVVANVANLDYWLRGYTTWDYIIMSFERYWVYLKQVLTHWDFGMYTNNESMYDKIVSDIPITFKLNLYAFLFYVPMGIFFGVVAAYFHKTWVDKIIQYLTLLLGSVPGYLAILLLMYFVGYELGWLPARYFANPKTPVEFFRSISIPVIALSMTPLSVIIRTMRGELIEQKVSPYLDLVRTKGLSKWQMLKRHMFRNSLIPVLFAMVLSVSFIIEITYDIHGAAKIFYESVITPHIDGNYLWINIEAVTLIGGFYIGLVMIVGLFVDFIHVLFDPRVKLGGKKSSY